MGLHHKLCHTLVGALDLPHAETPSLILPHAIAYNQPGAAAAMHKAGRAMGLNCLSHDLHTSAVSLGVPMALSHYGVNDRDIDKVSDLAVKAPYPKPVTTIGRAHV